jgi:hypothetical protein
VNDLTALSAAGAGASARAAAGDWVARFAALVAMIKNSRGE